MPLGLLILQGYVISFGSNPNCSFEISLDYFYISVHIVCGMKYLSDMHCFIFAIYDASTRGIPAFFAM